MSIKNDVEVRKGPGYNPVKGHGYFNKADGLSEFTAKAMAKAREPYTTREGQRVNIDVTAPGYHEAIQAAWAEGRPEISKDEPCKLWTMPWEQREGIVSTAHSSGIKDMNQFDELSHQAAAFGIESVGMFQKAAVEMGRDDFAAAMDYMDKTKRYDPDAASTIGDPFGELRNTGRFVKLEAQNGDVSSFLMEMLPQNGKHRFVDLECPEGTAQILTLEEGTYSVHSVWDESPMLTAGLESARKYFKEHDGLIPLVECGTDTEAAKQVSSLDRMHAMMGKNETDVVDGPAFTGSDEPGVI